jgi:hypothetical protein
LRHLIDRAIQEATSPSDYRYRYLHPEPTRI